MSSNSEFLERYSPLNQDELKRVTSSTKRMSSASGKIICSKPSPKKGDYGKHGYSSVSSDGVRR